MMETVFTEDMTKTQHTTHIDHLPHMDRWIPICDFCGRIGGASFDRMEDATAIAERHQEIGGFE